MCVQRTNLRGLRLPGHLQQVGQRSLVRSVTKLLCQGLVQFQTLLLALLQLQPSVRQALHTVQGLPLAQAPMLGLQTRCTLLGSWLSSC